VKPGKGGAYNQVELKNLINGTKLNERFRSAETVEKVRLEQKDFTFLYEQGDALVFMDDESYDQLELLKDFVGDRAAFLQDGMKVTVELLRRAPDRHLPARSGHADHHRGRSGREGADRRLVLQAGCA
jgi:elongation factor P